MHPLYQPQLDLVAESADGKLAAFCIGWLAQIDASTVGQIEPLGVLPMFQGKGLGRAILSESLQRFKHLGAKQLLIDAESTNRASQSLYESVGFIERSRTYKYFRIF
jgi:ribosomal-protein-alanine N-acetyltransferase